ncbi:MAG: transporter substrate-binding domain-containing protein [Proteobacteria bacterium]|nr:transporter substrate-binding domain-containing protein [Pseudomonadota bacterium]MBU1585531.1 transporter substrate-binding domain-containing protein [Pseudomonadota bacterium]MBU2453352.1 transporter substrate-binding domain-containing protein [Pseudomonadota bacterium]MBU2630037.1 transporter substrate-binding domain-containing protein [Pseudomonadota bacterium]
MKLFRILIVIAFLFSSSTLGAVELKLGGTEWSPYIGFELKNHGIAAEIVTKIFQRAGHKVEFKFYPWARTQHLVKTGELDGLAIAWYTEERAKTMVYSIPYVNTAIVLIKQKDDPFVYNKIEDLEGKNIGVILGYGYLKKIESDKIQKTFVKSLEQNLLKLANKRIDLTMEEKLNAQRIIASLPEKTQNSLIIIENPFEEKELHITLSKSIQNHKELLNDFNAALASMIKDGSYQHMINSMTYKPLSIHKYRIEELKNL